MLQGTRLFALVSLLAGFSFVATAEPNCTLTNGQETCTFGFTGSQQTFTVPAGVTNVTIQTSGGQGGNADGAGGKGGSVTATISVTPGETLYIYVGSQGHGIVNGGVAPPGGSNSGGGADGGAGGASIGPFNHRGGGGGASSDVRQNGTALSDRVVVAGGGGGGGGAVVGDASQESPGGAGGGLTGGDGANGYLAPLQSSAVQPGYGGKGGTQTAGGAGGNNPLGCNPGFDGDYDADLNQVIVGIGGDAGDSCAYGAGGGGGGYHGGGGGQSATGGASGSGGGGGGSSFAIDPNASMTQGDHSGDGVVTISWIVCQPPTITSLTATPRVLWPPNGKMVSVTLTDTVSNGCGAVSCKIISVTSSDPTDPESEWQITGDLTLNLRASRIATRGGILNGRVYTITVQCTDASNNTTTKTITVLVPLDSPSLLN